MLGMLKLNRTGMSIAFLCGAFAVAQTPYVVWQAAYGSGTDDGIASMSMGIDGSIYVSGQWSTSYSGGSCLAMRVNAGGTLMWGQRYYRPAGDTTIYGTWGTCGDLAPDGTLIMAGHLYPHQPYETEPVWLLKINQAGDTIQTWKIGESAGDRAMSMKCQDNGDIVMCGYGLGSPRDPMMWRITSSATTVWYKTYPGDGLGELNDFEQALDGGYVCTGLRQTVEANQLYLLKTDAGGNKLWSKTYGGAYSDEGMAIASYPGGGYIVTGIHTPYFQETGTDAWVLRCDESGDTLWTRTIAVPGTNYGRDIAVRPDGTILVLGTYLISSGYNDTARYTLTALSPDGNMLWSGKLNGIGFRLMPLSDNEFYVGAAVRATRYTDAAVVKVALNNPPQFTSDSLSLTRTLTEGEQYAATLIAQDDDVVRYALIAPAPAGMAIDSATGAVSWVPDDTTAGTHLVTATATDTFGQADTVHFTVNVLNSSVPIRIMSKTPAADIKSITFGSKQAFSVQVYNANETLLTYAWTLDGVACGFAAAVELTGIDALADTMLLQLIVTDGVWADTASWSVYCPPPSLTPRIISPSSGAEVEAHDALVWTRNCNPAIISDTVFALKFSIYAQGIALLDTVFELLGLKDNLITIEEVAGQGPLVPNHTVSWQVKAYNNEHTTEYSTPGTFIWRLATSSLAPGSFAIQRFGCEVLAPRAGRTLPAVRLAVPESCGSQCTVRLSVLDVRGRRMYNVAQPVTPGYHVVEFTSDAHERLLADGVYIVRATLAGKRPSALVRHFVNTRSGLR